MPPVGSWMCTKDLLNNPPEIFLQSSEILLRFANNVLNNPENPKYRRIRISNPIVESKLLPVEGGMECLFSMGFQEDGEFLCLPANALLDDMTEIRDILEFERKKVLTQYGPVANKTQQQAQGISAAKQEQIPLQPGPEIFRSEGVFFQKLKSSFDHVLMYEDTSLQAKARDCIPLQELTAEAIKKHQSMKETSKADEKPLAIPDFLLLELLNWFKNNFFQWVDAPNCDFCGEATRGIGSVEPTPQEQQWGGGRVENYECTRCRRHTRFPRYNHPGKLLETRRGRCGEWANCFTLCCRAVGLEARYVLDWTDHVWTEVYSLSQERWLHCDPCENTCDKPLTYEVGWGKKLSYIVGFSKDEIQDVTWRYSANHAAVRDRRRECREKWLVDTIIKLTQQRQSGLPEDRKKILQNRLIVELVEFLTERTAKEGEDAGRVSGSLAWRLQRGEAGDISKSSQNILQLTQEEKQAKMFHVKYCCASDKYVQPLSNSEKLGWKSGVYEAKSIIRKVEHDWKMVYLARAEGVDTASISWKLDCTGLNIAKIEILVKSATYENGAISWRLCGDDQLCVPIKSNQPNIITDMVGCKTLTLTAELSRGKGDCAWQHTQLFRQSEKDTDEYPFDIKVTFQ